MAALQILAEQMHHLLDCSPDKVGFRLTMTDLTEANILVDEECHITTSESREPRDCFFGLELSLRTNIDGCCRVDANGGEDKKGAVAGLKRRKLARRGAHACHMSCPGQPTDCALRCIMDAALHGSGTTAVFSVGARI